MAEADKVLITILTGNLFVNLSLTALTTSFLLSYFGDYGHFISIGFVTPLIIVFGEITPKILAMHSYLEVSRYAFPVYSIFHKLLSPVRYMILLVTDIFIKAFNLKIEHSQLTTEELRHVVNSGEELGLLDKKESDIIRNMIRFTRREASNIMYPRNLAIFIQKGSSISEAMELIIENEIVRIPVFGEDFDDIIGVIDARDILSCHLGYKKSRNIDKYIKPIKFFPFSRDLNELLNDFLKEKIEIAIIVDEYGGTAGVVTLNTILSALLGSGFGDSAKKTTIRQSDENMFIVSGDVQIDEFNSFFNTSFSSNNSDTIGGLIIERAINFPAKGDLIVIEDLEFRIRNIVKRKIKSLEVRRAERSGM
jgi:CBS domain containing-hemolysin-like protein